MSKHIFSSVVRRALIAALCCSLWFVQGCFIVRRKGCTYVYWPFRGCADWHSAGASGGGEPGTRYFVLNVGSVQFQATPWGLTPELVHGGPHCASLDQFEVRFGDLKRLPWNSAAVKRQDGRCAEVAVYCEGVVCRRHTFDYDAAGRARRRTDTAYEGRREGEATSEWAERFKGRTPPVAWVSEIEYAWSEDGRTVEVTLVALRGKPRGQPTIWFAPPEGKPGQTLETWRLNGRGQITSVLRDGRAAYSAEYDDVGRLLRYETEHGHKVENRYDARGRLLETHVVRGGWRKTVVRAYPDGPKPGLPKLKEPGDEAWLVTHDKHGRVSRIRERAGPPDDVMANTFEEFRRDEAGRIIWLRVGVVR